METQSAHSNMSPNKNVVIFGGNGYIGNSIIEKWLEEDEQYNLLPAQVMLEIADEKSVKGLGYVGGVMGPKQLKLML